MSWFCRGFLETEVETMSLSNGSIEIILDALHQLERAERENADFCKEVDLPDVAILHEMRISRITSA